MFEIIETFMVQLVYIMPVLICLCILFDFIGSFFFNKR